VDKAATFASESGMYVAVKLRVRLQAAIERDIDRRTAEHQAEVEALQIGQANLKALGAPAAVEPLHILAQGDSWFDYPLVGNGPLLGHTVYRRLGVRTRLQAVIRARELGSLGAQTRGRYIEAEVRRFGR
jgi:hypothetical protein